MFVIRFAELVTLCLLTVGDGERQVNNECLVSNDEGMTNAK